MQDDRNLLVFSGNANRPLAMSVCKELGIRMGKALVGRFSDGEVQIEIPHREGKLGFGPGKGEFKEQLDELHHHEAHGH